MFFSAYRLVSPPSVSLCFYIVCVCNAYGLLSLSISQSIIVS